MTTFMYNCIAVFLSLAILYGINLMSSPKTAFRGNQLGMVSMGLAIIITLIYDGSLGAGTVWISMLIGSGIGYYMAKKVKMIQMPQMVALLNGLGGAASAVIAILVLVDSGAETAFSRINAGLALATGMVTLTGSLIAAGKLHQILAQKPVVLRGHSTISTCVLAAMGIALLVLTFGGAEQLNTSTLLLFLLSSFFGVFFTIRVGGADMPITISLLNSFSGVAGSIAGLAISDPLLVAVGGIVGASGLLLTQIMCRAMNRSLMDILLGKTSVAGKVAAPAASVAGKPASSALSPAKEAASSPAQTENQTAALLKNAKKVLIIPGYGMALAQAQHKVKLLADRLEQNGATVDYAIHPVAGRMPGHMNVLLAEANVDYEKLLEMDAVNPQFAATDLVIIVGANDVVNPAAIKAEGTPIYGMPILRADEAKHVIICNFDTKPGYAGVENPLYSKQGVVMMLGDANTSVDTLIRYASAADAATASAAPATVQNAAPDAAHLLHAAKKVLIIPGYGMALAQAQHKVKLLADRLEQNGAVVDYAIHPVAGRMPGHMNVLLAEANVDYEKLLEMDAVNPQFAETDLVIIVGANDVVNPAAIKAEGTPIYGMPILRADAAKHVIVCNFDTKPGYAGVENPLYSKEGVIMMLGDANASVDTLIGYASAPAPSAACAAPSAQAAPDAANMLHAAKKVLIIPGYGMALAQAQHKVKLLADRLEQNGAVVDYAIHPVAGRMPGHMNVLLAEANVDYEKLLEMDAVNPQFAETDLVIIVGANDVVNPAAIKAEGTPIYGMPILRADAAKNVIICNFDTKPGYAGVENPLYSKEGVVMMLGDANASVDTLIGYATAPAPAAAAGQSNELVVDVDAMLNSAQKVLIIPGYGMALAQAQHKVKLLADRLEQNGAVVDFAIHPVAGRMPGHMNVLLAEANVDYEKLLEMDVVNPQFAETDLVIIVGANDVVNPAAIKAEGTPIYGMPILRADAAKNVIICNFDTKPGYAGVENPLYSKEGVVVMLGDANVSVDTLIGKVQRR